MPAKRRLAKRRWARLTLRQRWCLELGGCVGSEFAFDHPDDWGAAWEVHRDRILGRYQTGKRPWAWWVFDRDMERPSSLHANETDVLFALGEMDLEEIGRVRKQYEGLTETIWPACIRPRKGDRDAC